MQAWMDHVLCQFDQIFDVRSQLNKELFNFFHQKTEGALLIEQVLLLGIIYTVCWISLASQWHIILFTVTRAEFNIFLYHLITEVSHYLLPVMYQSASCTQAHAKSDHGQSHGDI